MSAGPATRMYEVLDDIAASTSNGPLRLKATGVIHDLTLATLEAMDAAAEVPMRLPERQWDAAGMTTLMFTLEGGGVGHVSFRTEAERELLGALLARHIQRRKEGGA